MQLLDSTHADFNSIKVRLELHQFYLRVGRKVFQFHKGTIRTMLEENKEDVMVKFQFHKGTIRTTD